MFCISFLVINNFLIKKTAKFKVCDKSFVKAVIKPPAG